MSAWWQAFLLTQLVEVPVYLYAGRLLPRSRRIVLAVGASAVTHPVVWFVFPWHHAPYLPTVIAAELFAIATEAWLCHRAGIKHPVRWSMVANLGSLAVGTGLRALIGWP